ncbi:hypothetical protein HUJ04_006135 [Dendroctonus ponderosae]
MSGQMRVFVVFVVVFAVFCQPIVSSPCGICGIDVICKSKYPTCTANQAITLDQCGCCLVCKNILEKGEECFTDIDIYAICKLGLECINNKCTEPQNGPSG